MHCIFFVGRSNSETAKGNLYRYQFYWYPISIWPFLYLVLLSIPSGLHFNSTGCCVLVLHNWNMYLLSDQTCFPKFVMQTTEVHMQAPPNFPNAASLG